MCGKDLGGQFVGEAMFDLPRRKTLPLPLPRHYVNASSPSSPSLISTSANSGT